MGPRLVPLRATAFVVVVVVVVVVVNGTRTSVGGALRSDVAVYGRDEVSRAFGGPGECGGGSEGRRVRFSTLGPKDRGRLVGEEWESGGRAVGTGRARDGLPEPMGGVSTSHSKRGGPNGSKRRKPNHGQNNLKEIVFVPGRTRVQDWIDEPYIEP